MHCRFHKFDDEDEDEEVEELPDLTNPEILEATPMFLGEYIIIMQWCAGTQIDEGHGGKYLIKLAC